MKLRQETIENIKERRDIKRKLCAEMGWTYSNLYAQLAANKDDGSLTKWKAIQIISDTLNKPVNELYQ